MLIGIFSTSNLARERWCLPRPKLLYLFWENWRQVQPNESGRLPGPVAALELAAACIYKHERARRFQGETLPEAAENSDQPSPDQYLIE